MAGKSKARFAFILVTALDTHLNLHFYRTIIVRLISTAQTGFFYTTQRLRQGPKLSAVKYDPKVRQRVLFVESKKTKKS
ncbi:hypothetical protein BDV98DRAFT_555574 [Pterulicium gracile]|uniref:Large ribosomal subunit protein bL33m n=1 Tax=Pterulicium gracile TaxID=1884261 RepID=A0A5C3Q3T2_9AGAR|nr:hypothetical protein BDV98DRAFT_555574 [Pterula gracilis]